MTWDAFHRRGEVLRNVLQHAETYRDGALPMELPGVTEAFGDEVTLLGALQLRWHTRLAGAIERELMGQPMELETAVMTAWLTTARESAGLRAVLDRCAEEPGSPEVAAMLEKAQHKDWMLMAAMAGKASPSDPRAVRVGRSIEQKARTAYRPTPRPSEAGRRRAVAKQSFIERVKAHLAA